MSEKVLSLKEFKELVENHDFYYVMSDDKKAYSKGLEEELRIKALCLDNKEFTAIYDARWKKLFRTKKTQNGSKKAI